MMPETKPHASFEPEDEAGWWMMGPMPWARMMAQLKKAMPARGTKIALAVKRWRIVWTGNL
jgi:hypothetical protein